MNRAERGREREDAAAGLLEEHGYRDRGATCGLPGGEIDVIARERDTIVFVEVKARAIATLRSAPCSAVDAASARRCATIASDWLQIAAPRRAARFDVVTFDRGRARLHRGAFA